MRWVATCSVMTTIGIESSSASVMPDRVGRARAGSDEHDAGLAGRAGIALRHVRRALLVAHEDVDLHARRSHRRAAPRRPDSRRPYRPRGRSRHWTRISAPLSSDTKAPDVQDAAGLAALQAGDKALPIFGIICRQHHGRNNLIRRLSTSYVHSQKRRQSAGGCARTRYIAAWRSGAWRAGPARSWPLDR